MISKFKIKGLDCASCASELERAINKIAGIKNVSINFMTEKMEIEYEIEKDEIIKNVEKIIKKEEPDVKIEEI